MTQLLSLPRKDPQTKKLNLCPFRVQTLLSLSLSLLPLNLTTPQPPPHCHTNTFYGVSIWFSLNKGLMKQVLYHQATTAGNLIRRTLFGDFLRWLNILSEWFHNFFLEMGNKYLLILGKIESNLQKYITNIWSKIIHSNIWASFLTPSFNGQTIEPTQLNVPLVPLMQLDWKQVFLPKKSYWG